MAGIVIALLLSAHRGPRHFPLDAVLSGLAFALTGTSRAVTFVGHLVATVATSGAGR
ncbi:hypothetical protein GCM10023192_64390 [Amycolatopsis samaneae]